MPVSITEISNLLRAKVALASWPQKFQPTALKMRHLHGRTELLPSRHSGSKAEGKGVGDLYSLGEWDPNYHSPSAPEDSPTSLEHHGLMSKTSSGSWGTLHIQITARTTACLTFSFPCLSHIFTAHKLLWKIFSFHSLNFTVEISHSNWGLGRDLPKPKAILCIRYYFVFISVGYISDGF